jgi:arylsulfatase A-like enzyme
MQPTDPQATFLFIHLMSVHESGLRHENFKKWQPSTVPLLAEFTSSKAYEIAYKNNYHNGILQADASIRRIFELLASKGMLERALIIITADHGEYLGEFNRFHHGHTPYEPVSRIPLLIYDPLNPKYPDRALSSQIDIAPTFLQSIGARIPANWQGVPLQVTTARSSISIASGDTSGVVAIIEGTRYKYIRERNNNIEQLFDLDSPEGEAQNLAKASKTQPLLSKMRSLHKALE